MAKKAGIQAESHIQSVRYGDETGISVKKASVFGKSQNQPKPAFSNHSNINGFGGNYQ
jgi:hypothetical protein